MRALKATGLTYEGKTICGQVVVAQQEDWVQVRILPKHATIEQYEGMDSGELVKPSSVIVYVNGQPFKGLFSNYED